MKKFALIVIVAALASCTDTQPMPKGPGMGARVEAADGNRGDVPGVNHPNYNPNPYGYGNQYGRGGWGGWW